MPSVGAGELVSEVMQETLVERHDLNRMRPGCYDYARDSKVQNNVHNEHIAIAAVAFVP